MLEVKTSRQFVPWLREQGVSLAFSTYQLGKLFLAGHRPGGELSLFERSFDRCMGLSAQGSSLWMGSLYQVWHLENVLEEGERYQGYDALYLPLHGHTTGDVDAHDLALESSGRVVFASALFSCLATLSERFSFEPIWKPPFISRLAAEDRCHLNGLALRDGRAAYVTAISATDVVDGWRQHRATGGVVVDVASNQVLSDGLSMPHSPRWYRDRLWLLNSGCGELGWMDLDSGRFQPVCFCPGYLRGLAFVGEFAVVGLSGPRGDATFEGLELGQRLASKSVAPWCGLMVVSLKTGDAVHWLRLEGAVSELYDVVVLPGCTAPAAIGFKSDEIRRVLRLAPGDV